MEEESRRVIYEDLMFVGMGAAWVFPFCLKMCVCVCVFISAELPENWTDTRETILEGMTFNLRHLGMTLVDQPKGEDLSAAAVKRIVATVRRLKCCHLKNQLGFT